MSADITGAPSPSAGASQEVKPGAPASIAVLGGGPWGLALAFAAQRTGARVVVHTRRDVGRTPHELATTESFAEVARAKLVVLAVPSDVARAVLRGLGDHLDGSHLVVHGIRGLGAERLETVSDIVREETPVRRIGALGGPVQAHELTRGRPSAMVVGSRYPEVVAATTAAFQSPSLRVYATPDLHGLEWASALVGCLSIGVGFAEEAGAGPGLLAALISRGVDEAARIVSAAGADEKTMFGLGGYGDLLASIALDDRPEVVLGKALARGLPLADALAEAKLRVEAIPLIPRIAAFARERKVPAPGFDALTAILNGEKAAVALERLFQG
ncbi:MAG TPA: NAD(P)-binding domain-containing protein [Minicystis sp.]|nr:NAD(P)-binding domain-containing protein [Minicystis sp.]